ncbi:hypothetical protein [Paenibacillus sp. MBLB4367]|uniref:hypothetical protein n=1 Tax=Paenibacillus sp. MBLB4367 TaxID=3384767 RepID=UPI003907EAF5
MPTVPKTKRNASSLIYERSERLPGKAFLKNGVKSGSSALRLTAVCVWIAAALAAGTSPAFASGSAAAKLEEGAGSATLEASEEASDASKTGTGSAQSAASAEATSPSLPPAEYPQLPPVPLGGSATAELTKALVMSGPNGKEHTLGFTLRVANGGGDSLNFGDYWVKLTDDAGNRYYPQLLPERQNDNRIAAGTSKDYTFYAVLGENVTLQRLTLELIRWDFSRRDLMQPLGSFAFPEAYSPLTPAGGSRRLENLDMGVKQLKRVDGQSDSSRVSVTVTVENTGKQSVAPPAYEYALRTADGAVYPLEAVSDGTAKQLLAPGKIRELVIAGTLPAAALKEPGELLVAERRDGVDVPLPAAVFTLPPAIPETAQEEHILSIGETNVSASVSRVTAYSHSSETKMNVELSLTNQGEDTVTWPNHGYKVRTRSGLLYPVTPDVGSGTAALHPNSPRHLPLTASLPKSLQDDEPVELLLYTADGRVNGGSQQGGEDAADGDSYPIAALRLPAEASEGNAAGKPAVFSDSNGKYQLTVDSIYRLPWEESDQIVLEATLANPGDSSLPIPAIDGRLLLEGGAELELKPIGTGSSPFLAGSSQTKLVFTGQLPYTARLSGLAFAAFAKPGEGSDKKLLARFGSLKLNDVPFVKTGEASARSLDSRTTKLSVYDVFSYSADASNLIYAEMELENTDKRLVSPSRLAGAFLTKDGVSYPATVSEPRLKVSPGGKTAVGFWSRLPRTASTEGLQLLVGDAVSGGGLAKAGQPVDGFIHAAVYELPVERKVPQQTLNRIEIAGYELSLSKIRPTLGTAADEIQLSFDYDLYRKAEHEEVPEGHKLLIELEDGGVTLTEEIELEGGGTSGIGKSLSIGSSNSYAMKKAKAGLFEKIGSFDSCTLRVYDTFQGAKRLLASQTLRWFETN